MREGEEVVKRIRHQSLKLLGTVGDPIDLEAWLWYYISLEKNVLLLSTNGGKQKPAVL